MDHMDVCPPAVAAALGFEATARHGVRLIQTVYLDLDESIGQFNAIFVNANDVGFTFYGEDFFDMDRDFGTAITAFKSVTFAWPHAKFCFGLHANTFFYRWHRSSLQQLCNLATLHANNKPFTGIKHFKALVPAGPRNRGGWKIAELVSEIRRATKTLPKPDQTVIGREFAIQLRQCAERACPTLEADRTLGVTIS